jgi:hypothetical protein
MSLIKIPMLTTVETMFSRAARRIGAIVRLCSFKDG